MINGSLLIGIAAVAENGVIGDGQVIPWHIPADLAWFKKTTLGHTIVMGRGTANAIGRPLPGRITKILTRNPSSPEEVRDINSIVSPSGKIFLCGGAEIYASYIFECDELLITHVKFEANGDKHLPYFEHKFSLIDVIEENSLFKIAKYIRSST